MRHCFSLGEHFIVSLFEYTFTVAPTLKPTGPGVVTITT